MARHAWLIALSALTIGTAQAETPGQTPKARKGAPIDLVIRTPPIGPVAKPWYNGFGEQEADIPFRTPRGADRVEELRLELDYERPLARDWDVGLALLSRTDSARIDATQERAFALRYRAGF